MHFVQHALNLLTNLKTRTLTVEDPTARSCVGSQLQVPESLNHEAMIIRP